MLRRQNLLPLVKVVLAILFLILSIYYFFQIRPCSKLDNVCLGEKPDISIALSRDVSHKTSNVLFFWNVKSNTFRALIDFPVVLAFFLVLLSDILFNLKIYSFLVFVLGSLCLPTYCLIDVLALMDVTLITRIFFNSIVLLVAKVKKMDFYYGYIPKMKNVMTLLLAIAAILTVEGTKILSLDMDYFQLLKNSFLIIMLSFLVVNYLSYFLVGIFVGENGSLYFFLGIPCKRISMDQILIKNEADFIEYNSSQFHLIVKKSKSSPPTSP